MGEMNAVMSHDTNPPLTDQELIERLRADDMEALGGLYRRYNGMVRSAVRRSVGSITAADVDDLTQEVFLGLRRAAERYEERLRFRAWLYAVAVRKAGNFRRTSFLRARLLRSHSREERAVHGNVSSSPLRAVETREEVEHILAKLTEGQREVMVLRVFEGFTGPEISEILGIRPKTVKNRMHLARKLLIEELGEREVARAMESKER